MILDKEIEAIGEEATYFKAVRDVSRLAADLLDRKAGRAVDITESLAKVLISISMLEKVIGGNCADAVDAQIRFLENAMAQRLGLNGGANGTDQ